MTAPVEMAVDPKDPDKRETMAFLYQSQEVGALGEDGKQIEVKDMAPEKALSYTWQGRDSQENLAVAKAALDAELAQRKIAASSIRLLGYNGSSVPRSKQTWELQAILPKHQDQGEKNEAVND